MELQVSLGFKDLHLQHRLFWINQHLLIIHALSLNTLDRYASAPQDLPDFQETPSPETLHLLKAEVASLHSQKSCNSHPRIPPHHLSSCLHHCLPPHCSSNQSLPSVPPLLDLS